MLCSSDGCSPCHRLPTRRRDGHPKPPTTRRGPPATRRGFADRLAAAATTADDAAFAALDEHLLAVAQAHRIGRVRAAARVQRWLATSPSPGYETVGDGLADHARELAWVDRALTARRPGHWHPASDSELTGTRTLRPCTVA